MNPVYAMLVALPFVVAAVLQLATRRRILSFLCGAAILPVMVLISVVVWPPGPRIEWQITLVLSASIGSIMGAFGTVVAWAALKLREDRRKPRQVENFKDG